MVLTAARARSAKAICSKMSFFSHERQQDEKQARADQGDREMHQQRMRWMYIQNGMDYFGKRHMFLLLEFLPLGFHFDKPVLAGVVSTNK